MITAVSPLHAPADCVQVKVISAPNVFDWNNVDASVLTLKRPWPVLLQTPSPDVAETTTLISFSPHVVEPVTVDEEVITGATSTVITTSSVAVHPFEPVPVTVYVV